jgi:hypothetical protein
MCSPTQSGSLALGQGTPSACSVEVPLRDEDHGRRCGTRPMKPNDQWVMRWCRRPTRLQLSLEVVEPHTEFSKTPYGAVAQTWIRSCGASCPPPGGPSPRQRLVGGSSRNPSMKNHSLDVGLLSFCPTACLIFHEKPHEIVLRGQ